jgi:pimeloyl-ACP methyl ester carboxylesterase
MQETKVQVRGGMFAVDLLEAGSGAPLLYLHGWNGLQWDPFLEALAQKHHVIAPRIPGYGDSSGDEHLVDYHDLLVFLLDLLDALQLTGIPVVAHSLGAMIALDVAALQPERFSTITVIAPFGIWDPARPILDFFVATPPELAAAIYADQDSELARAAAAPPADEETRIAVALERAKSLRTAAKYLWPIPNRGLNKRIHRVTAPTLVIWGKQDGIAPASLAEDFRARLAHGSVLLLDGAGHAPQLEQPQAVLDAVERQVGAA